MSFLAGFRGGSGGGGAGDGALVEALKSQLGATTAAYREQAVRVTELEAQVAELRAQLRVARPDMVVGGKADPAGAAGGKRPTFAAAAGGATVASPTLARAPDTPPTAKPTAAPDAAPAPPLLSLTAPPAAAPGHPPHAPPFLLHAVFNESPTGSFVATAGRDVVDRVAKAVSLCGAMAQRVERSGDALARDLESLHDAVAGLVIATTLQDATPEAAHLRAVLFGDGPPLDALTEALRGMVSQLADATVPFVRIISSILGSSFHRSMAGDSSFGASLADLGSSLDSAAAADARLTSHLGRLHGLRKGAAGADVQAAVLDVVGEAGSAAAARAAAIQALYTTLLASQAGVVARLSTVAHSLASLHREGVAASEAIEPKLAQMDTVATSLRAAAAEVKDAFSRARDRWETAVAHVNPAADAFSAVPGLSAAVAAVMLATTDDGTPAAGLRVAAAGDSRVVGVGVDVHGEAGPAVASLRALEQPLDALRTSAVSQDGKLLRMLAYALRGGAAAVGSPPPLPLPSPAAGQASGPLAGFLFKHSSRSLLRPWTRRWCFLHNGALMYVTDASDEDATSPPKPTGDARRGKAGGFRRAPSFHGSASASGGTPVQLSLPPSTRVKVLAQLVTANIRSCPTELDGGSSGAGTGGPSAGGGRGRSPSPARPVAGPPPLASLSITLGSASYAAAHAFEVVTPHKTITLAADTLAERRKWVTTLRAAAEAALIAAQPTPAGGASGTHGAPGGAEDAGGQAALPDVDTREGLSELIRRLNAGEADAALLRLGLDTVRAGNPTCADCDAPNPDWASLNLGCVFCLDCSGVHRSLGAHVSKVRSLVLDEWLPVHLSLLLQLGNDTVNELLEAKLPPAPVAGAGTVKPALTAGRAERERFITEKYAALRWARDRAAEGATACADAMLAAVRDEDLPALLTAVLTAPAGLAVAPPVETAGGGAGAPSSAAGAGDDEDGEEDGEDVGPTTVPRVLLAAAERADASAVLLLALSRATAPAMPPVTLPPQPALARHPLVILAQAALRSPGGDPVCARRVVGEVVAAAGLGTGPERARIVAAIATAARLPP
jgi:hypothetical protein